MDKKITATNSNVYSLIQTNRYCDLDAAQVQLITVSMNIGFKIVHNITLYNHQNKFCTNLRLKARVSYNIYSNRIFIIQKKMAAL